MDLHKNCQTLSIYSFTKILETQDYRFLIVDFDELDSNKVYTFDTDELFNIFKDIINEYYEILGDKKPLQKLKEEATISLLEFKYRISWKILTTFSKTNDYSVLLLLNEIKDFNLNLEKNIDGQLDKIYLKVKSFKNQIKIKKIKFKEKYKKDHVDDKKTNLDRDALMLETNLKLGYRIDTKTTSVERWLNMMNLNEDKSKANG